MAHGRQDEKGAEFNRWLLHLKYIVSNVIPNLEQGLHNVHSQNHAANKTILDQTIHTLEEGQE